MHIIFGNISYWQIPIMKILKYLKFEVFYLYIEYKSDLKKKEIAAKLKEKNIVPLPIEFQNKISSKASNTLRTNDPDEIAYKKNIKLIPDKILKKYCKLFSLNEDKVKKLRMLLQDFISFHQLRVSGILGIWAALYPEKKIFYISFRLKCLYNSDTGDNIFKIIIPLDVLKYFKKIIFNTFKILISLGKKKSNNVILNEKNFNEALKKTVAFIPHRGLIFGSETNKIFEKTLYYSEDVNSHLNKYNILHLDYAGYPSPEKHISWVSLDKMNISKTKIFLKTFMAIINTLYLIRGWQTFLGWMLCIYQYSLYIKYNEAIKKFKNLKIAIIDYEVLCPKALILALEKNNVKTVACQERFIHTFFTSWVNVMVDIYYVASEYVADFIKDSRYHDIKKIIPIGLYRSEYISLYKNKNIPHEISQAKDAGKKVVVFLGHHSPIHWFDSQLDIITSWSAQVSFLEEIIKFSKSLDNIFIIIRYKNLNWTANLHFKNILDKIKNCENIIISTNQGEAGYAYKLCANADLVVAKHTSLVDECLCHEIPVLIYEYTHNMRGIISEIFDYLSSGILCYNFKELFEKSVSLLFDSSNKLKDEISRLNKTIYYVKEKGNIKNKIIKQLENLIYST